MPKIAPANITQCTPFTLTNLHYQKYNGKFFSIELLLELDKNCMLLRVELIILLESPL